MKKARPEEAEAPAAETEARRRSRCLAWLNTRMREHGLFVCRYLVDAIEQGLPDPAISKADAHYIATARLMNTEEVLLPYCRQFTRHEGLVDAILMLTPHYRPRTLKKLVVSLAYAHCLFLQASLRIEAGLFLRLLYNGYISISADRNAYALESIDVSADEFGNLVMNIEHGLGDARAPAMHLVCMTPNAMQRVQEHGPLGRQENGEASLVFTDDQGNTLRMPAYKLWGNRAVAGMYEYNVHSRLRPLCTDEEMRIRFEHRFLGCSGRHHEEALFLFDLFRAHHGAIVERVIATCQQVDLRPDSLPEDELEDFLAQTLRPITQRVSGLRLPAPHTLPSVRVPELGWPAPVADEARERPFRTTSVERLYTADPVAVFGWLRAIVSHKVGQLARLWGDTGYRALPRHWQQTAAHAESSMVPLVSGMSHWIAPAGFPSGIKDLTQQMPYRIMQFPRARLPRGDFVTLQYMDAGLLDSLFQACDTCNRIDFVAQHPLVLRARVCAQCRSELTDD